MHAALPEQARNCNDALTNTAMIAEVMVLRWLQGFVGMGCWFFNLIANKLLCLLGFMIPLLFLLAEILLCLYDPSMLSLLLCASLTRTISLYFLRSACLQQYLHIIYQLLLHPYIYDLVYTTICGTLEQLFSFAAVLVVIITAYLVSICARIISTTRAPT